MTTRFARIVCVLALVLFGCGEDDPYGVTSYTLTVNLAGGGSGTVSSNPAGIACSGDCSQSYSTGATVTLTATATEGSTFAGWTGGGCSGSGTCQVTVSQSTSVTATFDVFLPGWPDSSTSFCTTGTAGVACPGGVTGQDGQYTINVPTYTVTGGRVRDAVTGLVWERNPPTTGIAHAAAVTYCGGLALDGFTDWRLPSLLELASLVDAGLVGPPFNTTAFSGIPSNSMVWTSTDRPGTPTQAYVINTNYAVTRYIDKTTSTEEIVRCVRGTTFSGNLSSAGGSVTDSRTSLVWQGGVGPDATWQNALAYCEGLGLDGYTNWRLPNIKELLSIVDPTQASPTISPLFSSRPATSFWSSTSLPNFPTTAYAVSFSAGGSDDIETTFALLRSVRCVR